MVALAVRLLIQVVADACSGCKLLLQRTPREASTVVVMDLPVPLVVMKQLMGNIGHTRNHQLSWQRERTVVSERAVWEVHA